jgi:tRNA G18 (ribose-2'-O)-methylase SpoU
MSVDELLASGRPIFVADAKGSTSEMPTGILVLGSEGQGVSPLLRERSRAIAIKTSGKVESINVAAAAAILLWRSFTSSS